MELTLMMKIIEGVVTEEVMMMTTSSWLWNWEEVTAFWETVAGTTPPLTAA